MSAIENRVNVLFIHEDSSERTLLEETFDSIENRQFDLRAASSEDAARKQLKDGPVDLVILDYHPTPAGERNVDRLNFIRNLRRNHPDLPLITITSQGNERIAAKLLRAGCDDYRSFEEITPFTLNESIRYSRRYRNKQRKLRRTARIDRLTGLRNRKQTLNVARDTMKNAIRHERPVFLALLDVDDFKRINNAFGHVAGDRILEQVAEILSGEIRAGDTAGRYGGDKFLLLLTDTDLQGAQSTLDRILEAIEETTFTVTGDVEVLVNLTISAGLTEFSGNQFGDHRPLEDLNGIMNRVDQALYHAKKEGGNRVEKRRFERTSVRTFPIQISYGTHRHDAELIGYSQRGLRLRFQPMEEFRKKITVSFETEKRERVERAGQVEWSVDDPSTDLVLVGLAVDVPISQLSPLPQPEENTMKSFEL